MTSNARNLSRLLGSGTTVASANIDPAINQNISEALALADAPPAQGLNNSNDLPLTGNDIGDQAYVASTGRLYIWTGSGWFSIALINQNPAFDSGGAPDSSYQLDSAGGSPTIIQLSASDPEEVPVQWSYVASDSAQYIATIQQDSSVFTITAKPTSIIEQYDSTGGTFSVTFKASDGVNLATALSEFTISFFLPQAWDLSYAVLDTSLSQGYKNPILSQTSATFTGIQNAFGMYFRSDGLALYICGGNVNATYPRNGVSQYSLSTAWDLSTITYVRTLNIGGQETKPYGIHFKPDGTKMYIYGQTGKDINEYNLSTPWNISTTSFVQVSAAQPFADYPTDIFFTADGLKMFYSGYGASDYITGRSLTTPWDISTLTGYDILDVGTLGQVLPNVVDPWGFTFSDDGMQLFVVETVPDHIYSYSLTAPYVLGGAVYNGVFSSSGTIDPVKIQFRPGGLEMFVLGQNSIKKYKTELVGFSVVAQDNNPSGVAFKPDGTKMYMVGTQFDRVYEYNLSTPWDLKTAAYLQNFSVQAQETNPNELFFKPDGTKMYIVGSTTDTIYEYNLTTAWDISTASLLQSFSVAAQEITPHGLFFRSDGLKMFLVGASNVVGSVSAHEYDLGTAWDVSTAVYVQSKSVQAQEQNPTGLFFKPDGTKMFILGTLSDAAWEYELSVPWDISTATAVQSLSVLSQDGAVYGLTFKPDGLSMYATGFDTDAIIAYNFVV